MGFFSLVVECSICGEKVGFHRFELYKGEWICPKCLNKCGGILKFAELQELSISEIQEIAGYKKREKPSISMNPTKKIKDYLEIDEDSELIKFFEEVNKVITNEYIMPYSDILSYELIENGNSIVKSGLGSTIAGGVLLGNVGAIVGSNLGKKSINDVCNELVLKITTKNLDVPVIYINFISSKISKDTEKYKIAVKDAQECSSILQIVIEMINGNSNSENDSKSYIVKIRELAKLKDEGILTESEFENKKNELLKKI